MNTKTLIVDSDPGTCELTQNLCLKAGIPAEDLIICWSGVQAIKFLVKAKMEGIKIGLVIASEQMLRRYAGPVVNGFEVIQTARAFFPIIKTIFLTAAPSCDHHEITQIHRFNAYVVMPYQTAEFAEVIREVLHLRMDSTATVKVPSQTQFHTERRETALTQHHLN